MLSEIFNPTNYAFLNPYSVVHPVAFLLFLCFGLFVLIKNHRRRTNVTLGLWSLFSAWWQFWFFLAYNTLDPDLAYLLIKIGFVGVPAFSLVVTDFIISFFRLSHRFRWFFRANYLIGFLFTLALADGDLLLGPVAWHFWGYYTTAGILFIPYMVWFSLMMGVAYIATLYHAFNQRKLNSLEKTQARYFLVGITLAIAGSADYIPNFGPDIYPYATISFSACFLIFLYAFIKYRLMDIETAVHKTLAWLTASFILLLPITVTFVFIMHLVEDASTAWKIALYFVLFNFFYWVKMFLQPKINRLFHRKQRQVNDMAYKTIDDVYASTSLDEAVAKLSDGLYKMFFPRVTSVYVKNDDRFILAGRDSGGRTEADAMLPEDVARILKISHAVEASDLGPDRSSWLKDRAVEVVSPLLFREEIIGFIFLGKKENLKPYNLEDIRNIEHICNNLSLAVNNFLRSEELRQYERGLNQKLEKEVEARTKEVMQNNIELKKFNDLAVGREMKMIELKDEIARLKSAASLN